MLEKLLQTGVILSHKVVSQRAAIQNKKITLMKDLEKRKMKLKMIK
jgi:hypothetical protein